MLVFYHLKKGSRLVPFWHHISHISYFVVVARQQPAIDKTNFEQPNCSSFYYQIRKSVNHKLSETW